MPPAMSHQNVRPEPVAPPVPVFGPVIAPPAPPPGLVAAAAGRVGAGAIVLAAVGMAVLEAADVAEAFGVEVRTIVTGVEVDVDVDVDVDVLTERPACAGWVPPTAAAKNSAMPPTAATTPAPMILFKVSLLLDTSFLRPDDTRPHRDRQEDIRLILSTVTPSGLRNDAVPSRSMTVNRPVAC
jgi:hypothetical protein